MQKTVIIINGRGGVGKDTLCELAAKHFRVRNISSITPVKEIAATCGWTGEKTDRARKFLSDLKRTLVAYNDYPTSWVMQQYTAFLKSDDDLLFVHIREPEEIRKLVERTGRRAKTLLIRGGDRMAAHAYGNRSDDEVEDYPYDYYFTNDRPLAETEGAFVAFLREILLENP